jgi:membrane protease YdiL (CAAX protease family)
MTEQPLEPNPLPFPMHPKKAPLEDQHPALKTITLLGFSLLGGALATLLGLLGAQLLFHLNILGNPYVLNDMEQPGVLPAMKFIQVASALGMFVLPALLLARLVSFSPLSYLRLNTWPGLYWCLLGISLAVVASPLINLFGELNSRMVFPEALSGLGHWMRDKEDEAAKLTKAFMHVDGIGGLLIDLFIIAFLAAVGEELLFRGALQRLLKDWTRNSHLAIWVTAVVFSAVHVQFFGFLPRVLLGALFGYLFAWSGSLWVPILGHFTNNACGVIIYFLIDHNRIPSQADTIGSSREDVIYILTSLIVSSALVFLAYRMRKEKAADILAVPGQNE